eukprot:TRINITY_DN4983_c0_g2_i2.p1 TRINITY_DN4983_c0_g2~~TRINITY_DN4983_c0_g2_i2.p1  ORF type:complete len:196 (+),score=31.85 TRINITY_DN4983_c0_g2_i2:156-743(+)
MLPVLRVSASSVFLVVACALCLAVSCVQGAGNGYIGRYVDNNRMLTTYRTSSVNMTVDTCKAICTDKRTLIAGVELNYCLCGNNTYDSMGRVNDTECGTCSYNSSFSCGNPWRVAVYAASSSRYLECNGAFYSPASFYCDNGQLCPATAPHVCGKACYSTAQYKCCNNSVLVGKSENCPRASQQPQQPQQLQQNQ